MLVLVAIGAATAWQVALPPHHGRGQVEMTWVAATIYERAILPTGGRAKLRGSLREPS